jgi:nitroreductase
MAFLDINTEAWYKSIKIRRSRRDFNNSTLSLTHINTLNNFVQNLETTKQGIHIRLFSEHTFPLFFKKNNSYYNVQNISSYAIIIGEKNKKYLEEKAGYLGEAFILEATSIGLSTCWLFKNIDWDVLEDSVNLQENEVIYGVIGLGYCGTTFTRREKFIKTFLRFNKRKSLKKLTKKCDINKLHPDIKDLLECARLAPSFKNRQPWEFEVTDTYIKISFKGKNISPNTSSKRLDCGICMLHIDVAAVKHNLTGYWDILDNPNVAKYIFNL